MRISSLQQAFENTDTSLLGIAHPEAAAIERSQNHQHEPAKTIRILAKSDSQISVSRVQRKHNGRNPFSSFFTKYRLAGENICATSFLGLVTLGYLVLLHLVNSLFLCVSGVSPFIL